ncbi:holo-ACP synthase [Auritidibacter sp. NML120636]|uniref:holo-ACP synthase n=1 Tax=Auritidibacter sp. NML120636 TaxID=2170743 RepID=UPI000D72AA32|nr:holo-ACP synthase [Auritidibacter sp. NML120636]PXA80916.1 holo-ACP synthase [Auritidibacter sp. NML120636]
MIIGIGIDMVDINRFAGQLRKAPKLKERLFTPPERELNLQSLAARFAAKEAVAKALAAPGGMNWQHCTIGAEASGQPYVVVTETIADIAEAKGVRRWHLSLSHDGGWAAAMVVAEG